MAISMKKKQNIYIHRYIYVYMRFRFLEVDPASECTQKCAFRGWVL